MHELEQALEELLDSGQLEMLQGYYALQQIELYLLNRSEGAERYRLLQARIEQSCKRLSHFPFIKFVGISGSLSKEYAREDADIDFFIVTQANRLWIGRTILHLFKKLSFVKGSQHWYCMNYFVDESGLQIEEQNYFTAIELASLKPVIGTEEHYRRLMAANSDWLQKELPNYTYKPAPQLHAVSSPFWNRIIVRFSFDRLNKWLMKVTDAKWRSKWRSKHYPMEDYPLAFKTKINVSKNHLHNYQKKLLQHLEDLKNNKI